VYVASSGAGAAWSLVYSDGARPSLVSQLATKQLKRKKARRLAGLSLKQKFWCQSAS
jgi:hypothetical protein